MVFKEMGKAEYSERNLLEQVGELCVVFKNMALEFEPRYIVGSRGVLLLLRHSFDIFQFSSADTFQYTSGPAPTGFNSPFNARAKK